MRRRPPILLALLALAVPSSAGGYGWPLRPFQRPHQIRANFGDPRYHLGAEGAVSAFHFGVDIVAPDGAPVYAVEPGVVVRRRATSITVGRRSGRRFGYWHVRPVVRSGTYVRLHQLLGYVFPGWGHVHFAETFRGAYKDPLRKGALTPFYDNTLPVVASVRFVTAGGLPVDPGHVAGSIDIAADVYDTPPVAPPPPWQLARLAPATIWWNLTDRDGAVFRSSRPVDFEVGLPRDRVYNWIYAAGTYQNKPNRPGRYVFWLAHGLDTTTLPNGSYQLVVFASDTRSNLGRATVDLTIANG